MNLFDSMVEEKQWCGQVDRGTDEHDGPVMHFSFAYIQIYMGTKS